MKLIAYVIDGHEVNLRPAPVERNWMDKTGERFAYRCLPMNLANAYGWEILNPIGFDAVWTGGDDLESIKITPDFGAVSPAVSHFGFGVLTFHVPCIFRTPPGIDLLVHGPINNPKDGIEGLCGIVETDWSPYSFTMNWIFTSAEVPIRFEMAEPYCHIIPIQRGELENLQPELRWLSEEPELKAQHESWCKSRDRFMVELGHAGSEAHDARWQKLYYQGLMSDGQPSQADHRTRLRLKQFRDLRRRKSV
jgi:Family of unknown function (DUF6065)